MKKNKAMDFEGPIKEMQNMIDQLKKMSKDDSGNFDDQIHELEAKISARRKEIYANLTPWQTVQIARHPQRPVTKDYLELVFSDYVELHGDRRFSDDRAITGGFAKIGKQGVMLIAHNRGKNVAENIKQNFAQARPDGYRKALRLMKLAERFNVPIVTLIDTQGAFPGIEAEERGQAEAIARNLTEMARLTVPIISCVTGEGGSGGALGIGVGDVLLMLSHSIYSVISPEGCAGILWRDGAYASKAADALKLTAPSLMELGVVDEIIKEPVGGAHNDYYSTALEVKNVLLKHIKRLRGWSVHKLLNKRFDKYSKIGVFNK